MGESSHHVFLPQSYKFWLFYGHLIFMFYKILINVQQQQRKKVLHVKITHLNCLCTVLFLWWIRTKVLTIPGKERMQNSKALGFSCEQNKLYWHQMLKRVKRQKCWNPPPTVVLFSFMQQLSPLCCFQCTPLIVSLPSIQAIMSMWVVPLFYYFAEKNFPLYNLNTHSFRQLEEHVA